MASARRRRRLRIPRASLPSLGGFRRAPSAPGRRTALFARLAFGGLCRPSHRTAAGPWRPCRRPTLACPIDDELKVVAMFGHCAAFAERLRAADAAAVQDQGVGRPRPTQSLATPHRVALQRSPHHRTRRCRCGSRRAGRDGRREALEPERMAQDNVCRLAADARRVW